MKVILYMAISANGFITIDGDDTSWVSNEDFTGQEKVAAEAGNIVYGRRTYEMGIKENCLPVPHCLNVVVTSKAGQMRQGKGFLFTNLSPKKIIEMLDKKGFSKVVVAGGAILNNSFLKEGLVDEIYLDVEPVLIGDGKPLFTPVDLKLNLQLLEINKLSKNTVQLHYLVKK